MKENNNDIGEKQKYLVEEIINKNYDTEKFSEYISNLKENGTDLNNWTFDELKDVVSSFKNQVNSNQLNNEENIEKGVENVRNSFILCGKEQNMNLNNTFNNIKENPYDKIFNDKETDFKNVKNTMSDLSDDEKSKKIKLPGFEDYEIMDSSDFIDSSTDKLVCIKQKENSLSKYNNLYVDIQK
jgi:hypothetical protein